MIARSSHFHAFLWIFIFLFRDVFTEAAIVEKPLFDFDENVKREKSSTWVDSGGSSVSQELIVYEREHKSQHQRIWLSLMTQLIARSEVEIIAANRIPCAGSSERKLFDVSQF